MIYFKKKKVLKGEDDWNKSKMAYRLKMKTFIALSYIKYKKTYFKNKIYCKKKGEKIHQSNPPILSKQLIIKLLQTWMQCVCQCYPIFDPFPWYNHSDNSQPVRW